MAHGPPCPLLPPHYIKAGSRASPFTLLLSKVSGGMAQINCTAWRVLDQDGSSQRSNQRHNWMSRYWHMLPTLLTVARIPFLSLKRWKRLHHCGKRVTRDGSHHLYLRCLFRHCVFFSPTKGPNTPIGRRLPD